MKNSMSLYRGWTTASYFRWGWQARLHHVLGRFFHWLEDVVEKVSIVVGMMVACVMIFPVAMAYVALNVVGTRTDAMVRERNMHSRWNSERECWDVWEDEESV